MSSIVPSSSLARSSAPVSHAACGRTVRGSERRGADRDRHRARHLDEAVHVLLVPVATRVRGAAPGASPRGTRSRPCPVLHLPGRPRDLHVQRARICSGAAGLPSPIAQGRRGHSARSFSHGGACVTKVTGVVEVARSTGVAASSSAVIRSRGFRFSAAHVEELLERGLGRAPFRELPGELGALVEPGSGGRRSSPRTAARPRRGTSGRFAATRAG